MGEGIPGERREDLDDLAAALELGQLVGVGQHVVVDVARVRAGGDEDVLGDEGVRRQVAAGHGVRVAVHHLEELGEGDLAAELVDEDVLLAAVEVVPAVVGGEVEKLLGVRLGVDAALAVHGVRELGLPGAGGAVDPEAPIKFEG